MILQMLNTSKHKVCNVAINNFIHFTIESQQVYHKNSILHRYKEGQAFK